MRCRLRSLEVEVRSRHMRVLENTGEGSGPSSRGDIEESGMIVVEARVVH